MGQSVGKENKKWICLVIIIMVLQFFVASYFCIQKQGFHYDEYYSYYSSNVTYGLVPTDREWKDVGEITSEFQVREGEGFRYGLVKTMQGFDVHPPLYYMILHTICSFFPGVFSKWFGLGLNLALFVVCFWLMAYLANHIFKGNKKMVIAACLLYGFQTGVLSGITFIRMYMLLTVWCLAITLWHKKVWQEGLHMTVSRSAGLSVLVMLGFLTHYYFAVFMFFTAAFICLYYWLVKKNLKSSIYYGLAVCLGMGTAVVIYPSCLSHIFRGYRGTEATDAFFDMSNTVLRFNFFTDLMNQSVFGGCFWFLVLILLLLMIGVNWGLKRTEKKEKWSSFVEENTGIVHIGVVTAGYFLVVAKTALLNAEEANRYELPVYGFIMMLVMAAFYFQLQKLGGLLKLSKKVGKETVAVNGKGEKNYLKVAGFLLVGIVLSCQIFALTQDKVQFLYRQDRENVEWAAKQKEKAILYLYNPNNVWMIWDEAEELMQYDNIYFVSLSDVSPITDNILLEEEEIYVYASRMEEADILIEQLLEDNVHIKQKEHVRELLYCDLYHLH